MTNDSQLSKLLTCDIILTTKSHSSYRVPLPLFLSVNISCKMSSVLRSFAFCDVI
jgi:hypothetical protein